MTLTQLYAKVPVAKHVNIKVIGNIVMYDSGTTIYEAFIDHEGNLTPRTTATKNVLAAL